MLIEIAIKVHIYIGPQQGTGAHPRSSMALHETALLWVPTLLSKQVLLEETPQIDQSPHGQPFSRIHSNT